MDIITLTSKEKSNKKRIEKRSYFAIMLSILGCVLLMISQVVLSFLFAPVFNADIDRTTEIIFEMIIYVSSFVVAFGFIGCLFKTFFKNNSPYVAKRYLPQNPVLYIIGTIGICYLCNLIVQTLFQNFVKDYSVDPNIAIDTPLSIILYYVYIALLPAIFEELAFRHVILTNLLPYGKWGAIICSSLLFGIVHIDPPRIIFATVFGIMLAICREHTGSLIVPMIIHFINNAISVTVSIAGQTTVGTVIFGNLIYSFMIVGIVAVFFYFKNGLNSKKISLIAPISHGYKLSATQYISKLLLNVGMIPLAFVYCFFFYLYFLA